MRSAFTEDLSTRRDVAAHKETVRDRLEREGLSALEIRERQHDLIGEINEGGISEAKKMRLQAELEVMSTVLGEVAPEPTPREFLQDLKEQGKMLEAENYEHTLNIIEAKGAFEDAKSAFEAEQLSGSAGHSLNRARQKMEQLEEAYDTANASISPYHARDNERRQLKSELETLHRSANEFLQSSVGSVRERGQAMQAEITEKEARAGQLDRINRGLEPPPSGDEQ